MGEGWTQVGGGAPGAPIRKWGEPGDSIEGVLLSIRQGKANYSPLAQVRTDSGVIAVPLKGYGGGDSVADIVRSIPTGSTIRIVFKEKVTSKNGRPVNVFDVFSKGNSVDKGLPAMAPQAQASMAPQKPALPPIVVEAPKASEYDQLVETLKAKVGSGADAMLNALSSFYPDPAARLEALKDALKQQGVAL